MVGSPPRAVNAALSPVAFSPLADRTNRLIRLAPPPAAGERSRGHLVAARRARRRTNANPAEAGSVLLLLMLD